MTDMTRIAKQLNDLSPTTPVIWLHHRRLRVVYVQPGHLVLYDHQTKPPTRYGYDYSIGGRHVLAIDVVFKQIELLLREGRVA